MSWGHMDDIVARYKSVGGGGEHKVLVLVFPHLSTACESRTCCCYPGPAEVALLFLGSAARLDIYYPTSRWSM